MKPCWHYRDQKQEHLSLTGDKILFTKDCIFCNKSNPNRFTKGIEKDRKQQSLNKMVTKQSKRSQRKGDEQLLSQIRDDKFFSEWLFLLLEVHSSHWNFSSDLWILSGGQGENEKLELFRHSTWCWASQIWYCAWCHDFLESSKKMMCLSEFQKSRKINWTQFHITKQALAYYIAEFFELRFCVSNCNPGKTA